MMLRVLSRGVLKYRFVIHLEVPTKFCAAQKHLQAMKRIL